LGRGVLIGLVLATSAAAPATEGSISGTVRLFTRGEGGESVPKTDASSVVVYLTGFNQIPPTQTSRISQKNRTFIPDVLAVVVGQSVEFTNDDNLIHNVFSTSKARTFDLGKPRPGESRTVKFDRTGVVDVYCDIHEEMVATILVLPNRAFAVTGADGGFQLRGIPSGRYLLFAWSRRSDPVRTEVEVQPGQESSVVLELTETKFSTAHLGKYGQPYRKQSEYPR
jgi:plastocyanin